LEQLRAKGAGELTSQKTKQPKFIIDEASSTDLIGTHSPVAKSLATIVRTDADLKVIGLLGSWGSGKSTVLKLLEKELCANNADGKETFFFLYDAWLHQNDPPRRSFLEKLISFLSSKGLTKEAAWEDDIDRLRQRLEETDSKTTPTLTGAGKLVALTLLFFPVGLQLIGFNWLGQKFDLFSLTISVFYLGLFLIFAPLLVASLIYLAWRPTWWPCTKRFWTRSNWTLHKNRHRHDSIFSLFVNKSVDRVRNRTIRTPDPTSIEFQEVYARVMNTVSSSKRRFVFVVDNLDRISESEAVALWSTVRGFFLRKANESATETLPLTSPTVILPLDPGSVRRMFGKDHDDNAVIDELAQSFMDKTFDITFRVSPPVLSDWQSYLSRQLCYAFEPVIDKKEIDQEVYRITRLYESYLGRKQSSENVTPRTLIRLVNSIAALRLQWGDAITLSSLAYYAINKSSIEKNLLETVSGNDFVVERFDSQWKTSTIAIYYGVPVDKERWSHFLRQAAKVDSTKQRTIHHEDAETVFG
jgi:hypothetical protein